MVTFTQHSDQVENLLGALALAVVDAIAESIEGSCGSFGSDTYALVLLQHWGKLRVDKLSRQIGLAQSSTVRLVDRLERQGLVSRAIGVDKRTVILTLTEEGNDHVKKIFNARKKVLSMLISNLDNNEIDAISSISKKLLSSLTINAVSGERICRLCNEDACGLKACPVDLRYQTFPDALSPDCLPDQRD